MVPHRLCESACCRAGSSGSEHHSRRGGSAGSSSMSRLSSWIRTRAFRRRPPWRGSQDLRRSTSCSRRHEERSFILAFSIFTMLCPRAMHGVSGRITQRIQEAGRGSVWTPRDFLDLGARSAVGQALRRLVQRSMLQRLDRGVYSYPRVDRRFGSIAPDPDTVATAIARATGSRLQISGARAANLLGLSCQVPSMSVYLTDGPSRTVRVGRQTIQLKHTPTKQLYGAGTRAGLAFQALRHLRPDGIDAQVVRKLTAQLTEADKRILKRGTPQAPDWMRPVVDQVTGLA